MENFDIVKFLNYFALGLLIIKPYVMYYINKMRDELESKNETEC